jgi:transposase-like protein
MASPANLPFTVAPVECPRCHTKQTVHIAASSKAAQVGEQRIACAECSEVFSAKVMDRIIGGPFLI